MHARFAEPGSDFLAFLSLWDYLRDRQRELSASAFRRMCRREYLHYLRVREWQDVYGQLRQAARELGIVVGRDHGSLAAVDPASPPAQAAAARDGRMPTMIHNGGAGRDSTDLRGTPRGTLAPDAAAEREARFPADLADRVHISLLAGLLSHIGMKDTDQKSAGKRRAQTEFAGARGARFAIFPGLRAREEAAAVGGRGRAGRDVHGCGPGSRRASSPNGRSRWPRTWSGAPTASRTGMRGAARRWQPRR